MALNRQRGASDKLSSSFLPIAGTVINRDQLRRQLSEKLQAGNPSPPPNASDTGQQYAVVVKKGNRSENNGIVQGDQRSRVRFEGESQPSAEDSPGRRIHTSVSFTARDTPPPSANQNGSQQRQVSTPVRREVGGDGGSLETHVSLYQDEDGKVKGVVELSTLRQKRVPHIKVRVICLIDVSGSMLLYGDKQKRRSKISILKRMAVDIIDALEDEEDFFGVMTFGEETRELCPLARVSASMRAHVKSTVSELDKSSGFSSVTDLSSALLTAVSALTTVQQQEGLLYRNCIIVFSDGEINAGETDPKELVHVTREQIRQCPLSPEILADLWVNVSCVTTGGGFSQTLYLLSKMCGSDAYFYVDGTKDFPEADMIIPLMLRKTACAQMVSLTLRASHGAKLETHRCSQEYSVRRRGGRDVNRDTMAYFVHDMSSGTQKTFQVSLDLDNLSSLHEDFLSVNVQYVDSLGVLHEVSKSVQRQELASLHSHPRRALQGMAKAAKSHMRVVLQNTCRQVATLLEKAPHEHPGAEDETRAALSQAVQTGATEVEQVSRTVLAQLAGIDDDNDDDHNRGGAGGNGGGEEAGVTREEFEQFVQAIIANLNKLRSLVVSPHTSNSNNGRSWQFTKAMSSAVARELPTVTNIVSQASVLCPLPRGQGCDSRRTQALSLYVLGGEGEGEEGEGGSVLHSAARDLARSLADVLRAVEAASV